MQTNRAEAQPEPIFGLIERIYATVERPEMWGSVISEISQVLEGDSIAIYVNFGDSRTPELMTMKDMAESAWKAFAEYYALINPIMQRAERKFLPGTTWFSHLAMPDSEFERSEFYTDFYAPNDMHHTVGLRIPLWGSAAGSLSCQRPKSAGQFGPEADRVIQTLKPHLQRALSLRHQMSSLESRALGLGAALDAFDHGVLCMGVDGRMVFANGAAETILRGRSGLRLANGRLRADDPGCDSALQRILSAAAEFGIETGGRAAPAALLIDRDAGRSALRVSVAPYRSGANSLDRTMVALVFLYDLDQRPSSRRELLVALYGLTPAEVRVAEHLLAGRETREIAGAMRVTLETARFHVKRVLTKTGVRRQTEFMRLILTLPGV